MVVKFVFKINSILYETWYLDEKSDDRIIWPLYKSQKIDLFAKKYGTFLNQFIHRTMPARPINDNSSGSGSVCGNNTSGGSSRHWCV